MPRFYFDVAGGADILLEDDAVELPSLEAARAEAMMMAAEMAKEGGAAPKDIAIAIRDERRETLGTVQLTLAYRGRAS